MVASSRDRTASLAASAPSTPRTSAGRPSPAVASWTGPHGSRRTSAPTVHPGSRAASRSGPPRAAVAAAGTGTGRGRGASPVGPSAASRTLAAAAHSAVFTWNGRRPGWADLIRAANAATWGAAKELPVVTMVVPPRHATSTFMPRARNSVGGSGFTWNRHGSVAWLAATLVTDENSEGNDSWSRLLAAVTRKLLAK